MPIKRGGNVRHSTRLDGYDYSLPGAYFITLVTHQQGCLFGKIVEGKIDLSTPGKIAWIEWFKSASVRNEIELNEDEFVVMPNHVHGIVWITTSGSGLGVRAHGRAPLQADHGAFHRKPRSLSSFIAGYKASVTKQINQLRNTPGSPVWMRNYHDRIIRNDRELIALQEYIRDNPLRWELDRENPKHEKPVNRL